MDTPIIWRRKAFAFLPIVLLIVEVVTIVSAYKVSFQEGEMDFLGGKIQTPPISMLMYKGRGKIIGQVGFPLVSLLGWVCLTAFFKCIKQVVGEDASHDRLLRVLRYSIMIAFFCLAIVGIIPLQENLPLAMKRQTPVTLQSIIHQSAAGGFFLSSMIHMGVWLYFVSRKCPKTSPFYFKQSLKSFTFKAVCFVLLFFPLQTAFLLHPVSPLRKRLSLTKADTGGIMQYALVSCVSSFLGSYSCEIWIMATSVSKKKE